MFNRIFRGKNSPWELVLSRMITGYTIKYFMIVDNLIYIYADISDKTSMTFKFNTSEINFHGLIARDLNLNINTLADGTYTPSTKEGTYGFDYEA